MNPDRFLHQYDASPDAALQAVRAHAGPLLIDLDETLYLRNSTEDFIDCARPGVPALLLLRILDVLKPWRLTGGGATRDNWRVCAIATLFPWTVWRWRARVASLAARHVNAELKRALAHCGQRSPIILTSGFAPIVKPLLAAMGFAKTPLIASRMASFADRRRGKLNLAVQRLGTDAVARSLVVTDALEDFELLQSCARPLRTVWPQARYCPALGGVYLPGQYVSKVKHPGERYILRAIVQEDFAFWCLSSIGLAANGAVHVAGLLLLLLSFWAIYERGYVDNDLVASRHEADPKLSATFGNANVATPSLSPWIWAVMAGAAGTGVLATGWSGFCVHFVAWLAVLAATHACFLGYNRLDKTTRVWLYPVLQLARSAAFLVVVPVEPAGAAALGAHVLSRWVPYQVYRVGRGDWPNMRPELIRLISFALLLLLFIGPVGPFALLTRSAAALLLWSVYRARRDLRAVFSSAQRIDRVPSDEPRLRAVPSAPPA